MKNLKLLSTLCCATLLTSPALAQDHSHHDHHNHAGMSVSGDADGIHAGHDHSASSIFTPAGIMGDHAHDKGEWMLSYRYMKMHMDGNRDGTDELSPLEISGDFANVTGVGPATLRIVPTEMDMEMHMLGAMYAPADWLTLMLMANYVEKDMDHITFAGGNADLEIGRFTTQSEGWGDTKLAGIFKVYESGMHNVVAKAGLSLPTGELKEGGTILNPMGAQQRVRLPYAMQIGSGTYDLEPGVTYTGHAAKWGWGAQYNAAIRLGENSQDYTFGDKHSLSAWAGYGWTPNIGTTLRITGEHEGDIDGRDSQIAGPVQTANPDNYGGKRVEMSLGLNLLGTEGALEGHGLSAEFTLPVYQNLNGPQMQRDYGFTLGYSVRF